MASPSAAVQLARAARPSPRDPALWFVVLALAAISTLHYLTDVRLIPYHSIYRSLYYVPIAVAAVRYGWRGGVLTAVATSVLYLPHVVISSWLMPMDSFNDALENLLFLFIGAFAGYLSDAERAQRQRAQEAAVQLVSANQRLQEQAAHAEQMRGQVASILESLDSGVVTLDATGRLVLTNRAAESLLAVLGATNGKLPASVEAYAREGARGYRQLTTDTHVLGLRGSPLSGAQGEVLGTVLVLDDLSELKALEAQVQRAQRLAALGRLAGGLAHEIRNPLGIVRAAAQMLHGELQSNARLGEYTQVIQSEVDRVDRLIEQLLAYARPRPLARGPVDLDELAERAVALTRAYAGQHGVVCAVIDSGDTPVMDGDAELLLQTLVNLLMNAVQATPSGGRVTVEVSAARDGRVPTAIITVRDTGRGIVPDDLQRVFDPFFTTRDDGVGLGLSIVQQIVQEHDGAIDVTSEPGVGTAFVIRLPAPSPQVHTPRLNSTVPAVSTLA
jgi:signal transduction histidine kinase